MIWLIFWEKVHIPIMGLPGLAILDEKLSVRNTKDGILCCTNTKNSCTRHADKLSQRDGWKKLVLERQT
jgi:hypothetical protein